MCGEWGVNVSQRTDELSGVGGRQGGEAPKTVGGSVLHSKIRSTVQAAQRRRQMIPKSSRMG